MSRFNKNIATCIDEKISALAERRAFFPQMDVRGSNPGNHSKIFSMISFHPTPP
jgi:hypothetical protein